MQNRIENILVVGGGTAGWLAALFLSRTLNKGREHNCNITLIESSDISTIGVGEATVPTLRETLASLGIAEEDFMLKCNATFKMAIKYVNWSEVPGKEVFWHPFTPAIPSLYGCPLSHFWLRRKLLGDAEPFDRSCYSTVSLCEARKSPRSGHEPPYHGAVNYAYHFDVALLATYLKGKAKASGVKHIVDNVLDVVLDENGYISHLKTGESGDLFADLFIDCSGFRGLLINKALQEPFIPYTDSLFCDSAVAIPIPHEAGKNGLSFPPYTTATAVSSGWIWDIPVFDRRGVGYVYSSAFISKEEAEEECRGYLGDRSKQLEARHLKMRVGRTRNAWVKNCISVGLSSGFVEPLESTGIFLIEMGVRYLWQYFPDKRFDESLIKQYNQTMKHLFEHVRDFLVLHYCITKREDTPFWRHNKYHPCIPDSLQAKLELWKSMLPRPEDIVEPALFLVYSYTCILAGMGYLPERSLPVLDFGYDTEAEREFLAIKNQGESLLNALPDHYEYIRQLHSRNAFQRLGP